MRKTFLRAILGVSLVFVALVGYQLYRVGKEVKSARFNGLTVWSKNDLEKEKIVEKFTAVCLEGTAVGEPVSVYECGGKYGTPEFVAVLKKIDDGVVAPAPLRWL